MNRKYDTMSEDFKNEIAVHFPFGVFEYGKFCFHKNRKGFLRNRHFFMTIETDNKNEERKAIDFVMEYAQSKKEEWIIVILSKSETRYLATNDTMEEIKQLLLSIKNLTPTFEFDKKIFHNAYMDINTQTKTIEFLNMENQIAMIKNQNDVILFNQMQETIINQIEEIGAKVLKVVNEYDSQAHFSAFDILKLFDYGFVFKIQKVLNGWNVAFFKKWNQDFMFRVNDLHLIEGKLIELADKHAREERFFALFR